MRCLELDAGQTAVDLVTTAKPFFDDAAQMQAGIRFFQMLELDLPDTWWVHMNMAILARNLGQTALADQAEAVANHLPR